MSARELSNFRDAFYPLQTFRCDLEASIATALSGCITTSSCFPFPDARPVIGPTGDGGRRRTKLPVIR